MYEACDHPKRVELDQDIRAGMPPSPVAKKYGLRHHAVVIQHMRLHMAQIPAGLDWIECEPLPPTAGIELARLDEVQEPAVLGIVDSGTQGVLSPGGIAEALNRAPDDLSVPPFRRFKQAWQDAKDDRKEQQRMVSWLQDQLQTDEMGL